MSVAQRKIAPADLTADLRVLRLVADAQRAIGSQTTIPALDLRARRLRAADPDFPTFDGLQAAVHRASALGYLRCIERSGNVYEWQLTSAGWDLTGGKPIWL